MAEPTRAGSSTVPVVGIIAIFALVLLAAWYFIIRDTNRSGAVETVVPPPAPETVPKTDPNPNDVEIKVDLPDSITIDP